MSHTKLQQRLWEVTEQIEQSFQMLHHALYKRQSELQSELDEVVSQYDEETEESATPDRKPNSSDSNHEEGDQEDPESKEEFSRLKFFAIKMDSALREIREFGTISMSDVDPSRTTICNKVQLGKCPVNEDFEAEIELRNFEGDLIQNKGLLEPKIELFDKHENRPVCEINEDSDCPAHLVRVKIRLPEPGEYDLSVKICENMIQGSPFTLLGVADQPKEPVVVGAANHESIQRIGTRGMKQTDFNHPLSVLRSSNDRLLITDIGNSYVQVFTTAGEYCTTFGPREKKAGKLLRPVDIAETHNGHFLITDYELKVVLVFDLDGRYVSCFGQKVLQGPRGVCVDRLGRIIVADNKDGSLVIFKGTGKFLRKIKPNSNLFQHQIQQEQGGLAAAPQALKEGHKMLTPNFVTITSCELGHILVTDTQGCCVRVFDRDGEYTESFGSRGSEWGQFQQPAGICCVPSSGEVIVADATANQILIFNNRYKCTNIIHPLLDPLLRPQGLAISADENQLIVVDSGNHCYRLFNKDL